MAEPEEMFVPEMLRYEAITQILVAYLRCGADREEKSSEDIAQISGVSAPNVGLNNKFFASLGLLTGTRGRYKLTDAGNLYARALDWGRLGFLQTSLLFGTMTFDW